MKTDKALKVYMMAGGTGGHVFPAISVAKELESHGWKIRWFGTKDKIEAKLVPQHGFEIDFLDIAGVRGNGIKRKLSAPWMILKSVLQARKALKSFKPDLVIGMGGFASGPGALAAWTMGIPIVIHEQNTVAGFTNKVLSKIATKVLCAFPSTLPNSLVVGNPVRPEFANIGGSKSSADSINILVLGGSLGARVLNENVPRVVGNLKNRYNIKVLHQVGVGNVESVQAEYGKYGLESDVTVSEFIHDMSNAYAFADLIICRSGALTVSEIAAVGIASILIPFPLAVDDHQTKNGSFLVNAGAAIMVAQNDIIELQDKLESLLSEPLKLVSMGQQAKSVAILDSDKKVSIVCQEIIDAKNKENK